MASIDNNNSNKSAEDDDYTPSTILVMLGPLHFEHAGSADVLSVKITSPEERAEHLKESSKSLKESTVDNLHVVLKSSSISSLYDQSIISNYFEFLKPDAAVSVHVLGSVDMPVQPADCDEIRVSFIMSGYRLEQEGQPEDEEGGWALTARKPNLTAVDEEEEEEEEEEE